MLQSFREQIKGWIATVVIGLLIIPFALWGVNSYFQSSDGEWVAQVDGEPISVAEFRNEYQQQLARFQQMLGEQYRPELFDTPRTREQVLDQMVRRALIELRVDEAGYRIGDAELADEIRGLEFFQVDGKFDRKVMRDRLAGLRMSEAAFDARLRRDMAMAQLPDAIARSEFVTPDEAARAIALLEEQRAATFIGVPSVKFLPQVQVAEAEVEQFYQANQARFMTEETVALDYLLLSPSVLTGERAQPTDAELQAMYDEEAARFRQPEQRRAAHILITAEAGDEAKAEQLATELTARAKQGADFAALAAQYSKDPGSAANGGDLGLVEKGVMVGAFDDAMFAMQPGEVRGPVKTEFGYHVIRLEEVRAESGLTFEQVKPELAAQWLERNDADRYAKASEQLADLSYSTFDSLQPAAEALGLSVQRVTGVTRSGGAGIATEPKVREAAFSPEALVERRNSAVIDLGEQQVVVVRVAEHAPAALRPLAEVRDQVVSQLRDERAGALAQAQAEAVVAELRAGALPEVVAKREKLPLPMTRTVKRNGQDAPPEVVSALFGAGRPSGEPLVGVVKLSNGDRMAYRIEAVIPGDLSALPEAEREARRSQLAQRLGTIALTAYTDALRRAADVKLQPEKTR